LLEEHNRRDKKHLINLIGRRSNRTPNFSLLIGAGASISSGVKATNQMIAEWRQQLYEESKIKDPHDEWLRKQDWFESDEEYSILFEKVCDQRSQRRIYIEECVKNARPSWGCIYLASLIANNYFNVTFTPNFDDLLNEACFIYANLRPIVCAHDSAVADIRVTSARPKIIKLHGDFLYDSIKNTIRETESLEKNMRDKFMQFAQEYGLVVIGYGGNDRSIMDILETMLRSKGLFPNGLYWCVKDKDQVSRKLQRLMRRENAYWVQIEGFDEFMAELHESMGLRLPSLVRDPYKATTEMLDRFVSEKVRHPVIQKDISMLEEMIKKFELIVSDEARELVPYRFLGEREFNRGKDYPKAVSYLEKALASDPDDIYTMEMLAYSYGEGLEDFDKALDLSEVMIRKFPSNHIGYYSKATYLLYMGKLEDAHAVLDKAMQYTAEDSIERSDVLNAKSNVFLLEGEWKEALSRAEKALEKQPQNYSALGNKCLALKKLGKRKEVETILEVALHEIEDSYYRACAFATLGEKENMLNELEAALEEDLSNKVRAKYDPDFVDYREDPDFQKLIYEQPKGK